MDSQQNRQSFQPDSIIFNEGESGNCAFIIEKGEVDLFILVNGQPALINTLHEGQIFGEMALLDDDLRCATAKTTKNTELLIIPRDSFQEKIKSSDEFVRLMLNVTLQRYREMRARLNHTLRINKIKDQNDLLEQENKCQQAKIISTAQQLEQENELRLALEQKQFELFYQPIISLSNDKIVGCEALIRWNHPEKGLVPPDDFIALSEKTGLIEALGLWIIEQACIDFDRFNQLSNNLEFISINLSGRQFTPSELTNNIRHIFNSHKVNPNNIKFEVTESILMANPVESIDILNEIKKMGAYISIDDFGTGYSSFSYLHRFPIDSIKIDRSFTSTMQHDSKSFEIVKSLCALAKSLNIEVIAEGIEQEWEENSLKTMEANFGQGYLYSKPLPAEAFIKLNQSKTA